MRLPMADNTDREMRFMGAGLRMLRQLNCAARSRVLHYWNERSVEFDDNGKELPKEATVPQMPAFLARHHHEDSSDE